jgi:hypothetical protein
MAKGEGDLHDEVMRMLEQKLKDTHEVLDGKVQVIGVLQKEVADKERELQENKESIRVLKDKLQVNSSSGVRFLQCVCKIVYF